MSRIATKWVKNDAADQYFIKETEKKWAEYQNGSKFADFDEIKTLSVNPLEIVLRKFDGLYIRLTKGSGYLGECENDISSLFCSGDWENYINPTHSSISNAEEECITKKVETYYNDMLKYIKDLKFTDALIEIANASKLKPDDQRIQSFKNLLEEIIQNTDDYQKLIADGNRSLLGKNLELAKETFKTALTVYLSVTQHAKILELFRLADLNLVDYIKKGKNQVQDLIDLVDNDIQENQNIKSSSNNNQIDLEKDQKKLEDIYSNFLKHVRYSNFSDALNEINIGLSLNGNNQKFLLNKSLLEKIIANLDAYNSLISEGNRYSFNQEFDMAKEKYNQALKAYLDVTFDPKVLKLFRDADLNVINYINTGKNQIKDLLDLIKDNNHKDDNSNEIYRNALRAIKDDLNYKKALGYFSSIKDIDLGKEIECLKKVIKNMETYYELIGQGNSFLIKKEYKNSLEKFREASKIYLEVTVDPIFIKLHDGDLSEYLRKNKAQEEFENAEKKIDSNETMPPVKDDDFWKNAMIIGNNKNN